MRRASITGGMALGLLLLWAMPASAATLVGTGSETTDCSLEARSVAGDGTTVLDEGVVRGTSTEGSQEDPFDVAWDGRVDFRFQTGQTVFQDNEWEIYAAGVPVAILKGSDDNPMDLDEKGFVTMAESAPGVPRIVGLVHVNGWIEGNGGTARCEGEGWIRIVGDPVGTIPWIVFVGLLALGLIFLVATPYTVTWEEGMLTPWQGGPKPEGH